MSSSNYAEIHLVFVNLSNMCTCVPIFTVVSWHVGWFVDTHSCFTFASFARENFVPSSLNPPKFPTVFQMLVTRESSQTPLLAFVKSINSLRFAFMT